MLIMSLSKVNIFAKKKSFKQGAISPSGASGFEIIFVLLAKEVIIYM